MLDDNFEWPNGPGRPCFEQASPIQIQHAEVNPDMNRLREHPRFKAMVATAWARLDAADGPGANPAGSA